MSSDYVIPKSRGYVSHLVVKEEFLGIDIEKELLDFVSRAAWLSGYNALTVRARIDELEDFEKLSLYVENGFDRILFAGMDFSGKHLRLLKVITDEFE